LCAFDTLQKNEQKNGNVFNQTNLTFFRSGKSEQWKKELTAEDVRLITKENGTLLQQLGYEIE
jgi:hypothetical protein